MPHSILQIALNLWLLLAPHGMPWLYQRIPGPGGTVPAGSSVFALVSQCVGPTATGTATTVACATTMNIAAGNVVAVFVRTPSGVTISSVADGTNTYSAQASCSQASVGVGRWFVSGNTSSAASVTITATYSATTTFRGLWAVQYSGVSVTTPIDISPVCNGASSGTTATSASFTTTHANEILLSGVSVGSVSETYTAGSGYTLGSVAPDQDMQGQYQFVSAIQTGATATMSFTASNPWVISQMTLRQ